MAQKQSSFYNIFSDLFSNRVFLLEALLKIICRFETLFCDCLCEAETIASYSCSSLLMPLLGYFLIVFLPIPIGKESFLLLG
jgi:hypothetical protein